MTTLSQDLLAAAVRMVHTVARRCGLKVHLSFHAEGCLPASLDGLTETKRYPSEYPVGVVRDCIAYDLTGDPEAPASVIVAGPARPKAEVA